MVQQLQENLRYTIRVSVIFLRKKNHALLEIQYDFQIKYQYWCPNRKGKITVTKADGLISKCDPYFHGVRALKYYIKKFKPLSKALCYYNNSKKCKKTYKSDYVKGVYKRMSKTKSLMRTKYYKEGFYNQFKLSRVLLIN